VCGRGRSTAVVAGVGCVLHFDDRLTANGEIMTNEKVSLG